MSDVGFKETVEYFIKCLELTPDTVENAEEWKRNIPDIKKHLLDTPTIQDPYTIDDLGKFLSDIENEKITDHNPADPSFHSETPKKSITKRWYFDVQWSDCPESVESEVRELWSNYELGNDHFMYDATVDEELFGDYPRIYLWLISQGVPKGDEVIIHWWW